MGDCSGGTNAGPDEGLAAHKEFHTTTQKRMWIITHGSNGPYITPTMLRELGQIEADECHSTKDRALVYTYIHLIKRVRQSTIEKFMTKARENYGIIRNEVYGYDSIAANSGNGVKNQIQNHPAFQMLIKHFIEKNPAFKPLTDGEPVIKRGLILRATETIPERPQALEGQSKAQVITYTKKLEAKIKEAKKMEQELNEIRKAYMTLSDERSSLRVENAMLKRKIDELEGQH
jgi:hypothetical protein